MILCIYFLEALSALWMALSGVQEDWWRVVATA